MHMQPPLEAQELPLTRPCTRRAHITHGRLSSVSEHPDTGPRCPRPSTLSSALHTRVSTHALSPRAPAGTRVPRVPCTRRHRAAVMLFLSGVWGWEACSWGPCEWLDTLPIAQPRVPPAGPGGLLHRELTLAVPALHRAGWGPGAQVMLCPSPGGPWEAKRLGERVRWVVVAVREGTSAGHAGLSCWCRWWKAAALAWTGPTRRCGTPGLSAAALGGR